VFKTKTIKLEHGSVPDRMVNGLWHYLVLQVTDSTEFSPRDVLKKAQVDELCKSREWKVTIVGAER
jgi:hypothetical protein